MSEEVKAAKPRRHVKCITTEAHATVCEKDRNEHVLPTLPASGERRVQETTALPRLLQSRMSEEVRQPLTYVYKIPISVLIKVLVRFRIGLLCRRRRIIRSIKLGTLMLFPCLITERRVCLSKCPVHHKFLLTSGRIRLLIRRQRTTRVTFSMSAMRLHVN